MMVVAGAALESSGMARRLDPAHQARPGAGGQHIVNGLSGH
jgi:hypothetical protein